MGLDPSPPPLAEDKPTAAAKSPGRVVSKRSGAYLALVAHARFKSQITQRMCSLCNKCGIRVITRIPVIALCRCVITMVSVVDATSSVVMTQRYRGYPRYYTAEDVDATSSHPHPHTATHCNTLQHTATHCSTLQHTATHCNILTSTSSHPHRLPVRQRMCSLCTNEDTPV